MSTSSAAPAPAPAKKENESAHILKLIGADFVKGMNFAANTYIAERPLIGKWLPLLLPVFDTFVQTQISIEEKYAVLPSVTGAQKALEVVGIVGGAVTAAFANLGVKIGQAELLDLNQAAYNFQTVAKLPGGLTLAPTQAALAAAEASTAPETLAKAQA